MKEIIVLQHIACEGPGMVAEALKQKSFTIRIIRSDEGQDVPKEIGQAAGLVVMGGPMGVYEEAKYPFLTAEMKLIKNAVKAGKPVLGICLGSQLIAKALGAQVKKGPKKEIGWYPVRLSAAGAADPVMGKAPCEFMALHWHGDIFDLPPGAEPLASSDFTAHQAFRVGQNVYGILFHMEITAPMLREWTKNFSDELVAESLNGTPILAEAETHLEALHAVGRAVFGAWALRTEFGLGRAVHLV